LRNNKGGEAARKKKKEEKGGEAAKEKSKPILNVSTNTTIEYFEGFDGYITSTFSDFGWLEYLSSSFPLSSPSPTFINYTISLNGRSPGTSISSNSLRFVGDSAYSAVYPLSVQQTRTIGIAIKLSSYPSNSPCVLALFDSGSPQLIVRLASSGILQLYRGSTLIDTLSAFTIPLNTFVYLEFSSKIHPSTGSYKLTINKTNFINAINTNTQSTSNSSSNQLILGGCTSSFTSTFMIDYDDIYIRSDSTQMGDQSVLTFVPTGNSPSTNQWSPFPSTSYNFQCVVNANDSDYVSSSTPNQEELYVFNFLNAPMNFNCLSLSFVLSSDTPGVSTFNPIYQLSGTDYPGVTQTISSSTPTVYNDVQGLSPVSGLKWTAYEANAMFTGLKKLT
jgi:hypothetical protein